MSWQLWVVVCWLIFVTLVTIGMYEHLDRVKTTPKTLVIQTVINMALIVLIITGSIHA